LEKQYELGLKKGLARRLVSACFRGFSGKNGSFLFFFTSFGLGLGQEIGRVEYFYLFSLPFVLKVFILYCLDIYDCSDAVTGVIMQPTTEIYMHLIIEIRSLEAKSKDF